MIQHKILCIFKKHSIIPIIAITATWVDKDNNLIPFPEKFPGEASILKQAFLSGDIMIANHGLTHCVVGKHLPKSWKSNRKYHREFWGWLPQNLHEEHIKESQKILENYFEKPISIFVPPGNIWSKKTYKVLKKTNITKVIANRYMIDSNEKMEGISFFNDKEDWNFHDRELKLYGESWLNKLISLYGL